MTNEGFLLDLLPLVRCCRDGGTLEPTPKAEAAKIWEGEVHCTSCRHTYRITEGLLDLLGTEIPQDADSSREMTLRDGKDPIARGISGWKPSWRDTAEIEATLQRLGDLRGQIVLELGCGPGVYTRQLVAAGARLLAVDFSFLALRRNREQLPAGAEVGLVRADVGTLRLTPGIFDKALTTLYSNLPTPELRHASNRTVAEALKPGGCYIVSAHHQDLRRVWKKIPSVGLYSDGGIFYQCFTDRTLRPELDGFLVDDVGPAVVELPLISRLPSDSIRAWVARHAAALPGINRFGSILLATAVKPDPAR